VLGVELAEKTDGRSLLASSGSPASLTIFAIDADDATLTAAEFKHRREALWRATTDRYGAGLLTGLFQGGAEPGLIGVDPAELGPLGATRSRIRLDFPRLFTSVNPQARLIPAFVTGVITGTVEKGDRFAVAVNGRVAGVGSAYEDGSATRVGVMVSPAALHQGTNRVEVYALSGSRERIRLARVPRTDATFDAELVERAGRDVVKESGRREIPVVTGAVAGFVDALEIDGNTVTASGWAIDRQRRRVADRVLVFVGSRLIAEGRPSAPRPDIAQQFGQELERAGFRLEGVAPRAADGGPQPVRVLAISGGRAAELERP
jgi:hypothetical protein